MSVVLLLALVQQPQSLWEKPISAEAATVVLATADWAIVMFQERDHKVRLEAWDAATGNVAWQTALPQSDNYGRLVSIGGTHFGLQTPDGVIVLRLSDGALILVKSDPDAVVHFSGGLIMSSSEKRLLVLKPDGSTIFEHTPVDGQGATVRANETGVYYTTSKSLIKLGLDGKLLWRTAHDKGLRGGNQADIIFTRHGVVVPYEGLTTTIYDDATGKVLKAVSIQTTSSDAESPLNFRMFSASVIDNAAGQWILFSWEESRKTGKNSSSSSSALRALDLKDKAFRPPIRGNWIAMSCDEHVGIYKDADYYGRWTAIHGFDLKQGREAWKLARQGNVIDAICGQGQVAALMLDAPNQKVTLRRFRGVDRSVLYEGPVADAEWMTAYVRERAANPELHKYILELGRYDTGCYVAANGWVSVHPDSGAAAISFRQAKFEMRRCIALGSNPLVTTLEKDKLVFRCWSAK